MSDMLLPWRLSVQDTDWDTSQASIVTQIEVDACFVQSRSSDPVRVDASHLVIMDGLVDEQLRAQLLQLLTADEHASEPPAACGWSRCTADDGQHPIATWGLKEQRLQVLRNAAPIIEVNSRLQKLYSTGTQWYHMPSNLIQACEGDTECGVDCDCFVANAAVHGDEYRWHVDADPMTFPASSPWVQRFGDYFNRDTAKPRFVSLLVYLNSTWPLEFGSETLFLDGGTDTGILVRPKPGRAVLMDQDIMHRVSAPSADAGRPRYSLVWKLLLCDASGTGAGRILLPGSAPAAFGTADRMRRVQAALTL